MAYCLPKKEMEKLLKGVHDGSFNFDSYAEFTSTEARQGYLEKFVGADNAKEVNTLMESKLLLKDWKRGMVTAIKKMTGLSEKAKTDYVSKIEKMTKVLSPTEEHGFLSDIAEKKLGVGVTEEEFAKISDLSKKIEDAKSLNNKYLSGVSDEFLKATSEMRDYVNSLQPTTPTQSIIRNLTVWGRNSLLMNISTPLKKIENDVVNYVASAVVNRLSSASLKGLIYEDVRMANKELWRTFWKTERNTTQMENMDDYGKLGEGKNFDLPQGVVDASAPVRVIESVVRNAAKYSNKVAIDWEHQYAFVKTYQKAFLDLSHISSSRIALKEGLNGFAAKERARAIFRDSLRVEPNTPEGTVVRSLAQQNASQISYVNKGLLSDISLGAKSYLNIIGNRYGLPNLGDNLIPIAKIPANIIALNIKLSGPGIITGITKIVKGAKLMKSEDLATKYQGLGQVTLGYREVAYTVGALATAAYVTSQLNKNDFLTDKYGTSYVRLWGHWINLEYLPLMSGALGGMMELKKKSHYNTSTPQKAELYAQGVLKSLEHLPGIDELPKLFATLQNAKEPLNNLKTYGQNFLYQRGVPAFVRQLIAGNGVKGLFLSTTGSPTTQKLKQLGAK